MVFNGNVSKINDHEYFMKLFNDNKSQQEIANILGVGSSSVGRYIKKHNLVRPKVIKVKDKVIKKDVVDIDRLKEFYLTGKTILECAEEFKVGKKVISNRLDKLGIKRNLKEAYNISSDKRVNTIKERYGVDNVSKSDVIKKKRNKTFLDKYGVNSPMKVKEFKDKLKETNLERYGVENPMLIDNFKDKIVQTNLKRYGVENPFMLKSVKEKQKKTILNRYGVSHIMYLDETKNKIKKTNLERYGTECILALDKYKDIIKETNLKRYGVEYPMSLDSIKEKQRNSVYDKYNVYNVNDLPEIRALQMDNPEYSERVLDFEKNPDKHLDILLKSVNRDYITYNDLKEYLHLSISVISKKVINMGLKDRFKLKSSTMEDELYDILLNIIPDSTIIRNDRTIINPYEIDLYLPDFKIGFECNPTSTHNSSNGIYNNEPKPRSYHKMKTDLAEENGIFIFHVFGYEWTNNREKIISMIENLLLNNSMRYYARKTYIKLLDSKTANSFINDNHRQGRTNAKVHLGLLNKENDQLLSVMSFNTKQIQGISDKDKDKGQWELVRFCSLKDSNVIGGASKLFKYFIKIYDPKEVISFADRSHTKGNIYKILNFELVNISAPGYRWVKRTDDTFLLRNSCQKKKLVKMFDDVTDDIIKVSTEKEIMEAHDYLQVFDSGLSKFVWKK